VRTGKGLAFRGRSEYNRSMQRTTRIIVAVLALLLLVAGTALATRSTNGEQHRSAVAASHQPRSSTADDPSESPDSDTPTTDSPDTSEGAQLSDDHASVLVGLLAAQGITATADELKTLAAKYGVGGAVRLEAWAEATGKSVTDLASMYDAAGVGWGAFAHQLEQSDSSLNLAPGIGWIMGHGHGNANSHAAAAPGQVKKGS